MWKMVPSPTRLATFSKARLVWVRPISQARSLRGIDPFGGLRIAGGELFQPRLELFDALVHGDLLITKNT